MTPLSEFQIRPIIEAALREDVRSGDVTTLALIPPGTRGEAQMNYREDGVVCGLELARLVFEKLGGVEVEILRPDGAAARRGETVLRVTGDAAKAREATTSARSVRRYSVPATAG